MPDLKGVKVGNTTHEWRVPDSHRAFPITLDYNPGFTQLTNPYQGLVIGRDSTCLFPRLLQVQLPAAACSFQTTGPTTKVIKVNMDDAQTYVSQILQGFVAGLVYLSVETGGKEYRTNPIPTGASDCNWWQGRWTSAEDFTPDWCKFCVSTYDHWFWAEPTDRSVDSGTRYYAWVWGAISPYGKKRTYGWSWWYVDSDGNWAKEK